VGGDVENRNAHSLPMGKQNGTATLEASWKASYQTKHTLAKSVAIVNSCQKEERKRKGRKLHDMILSGHTARCKS
jgi:hypothetical protein